MILSLIILALLFFKPRGEVFIDTDNTDIAKIEVKGFRMYQIKENVTDTIIVGNQAIQYRDHEIFNNILISRFLENGQFEDVRASRVYRKQDIYRFINGVDYKKSDGMSFVSQTGVLNLKTEVFNGKGDFELKNSQGVVNGIDIVYDKKNEIVKAKKIKSKIRLD